MRRILSAATIAFLCTDASRACGDKDLERLKCDVPARVNVEITTKEDLFIKPDISAQVERLVRETLAEQGIDVTYRKKDQHAYDRQYRPDHLTLHYAPYWLLEKKHSEDGCAKGNARNLHGYAKLREREAIVTLNSQEIIDEWYCPPTAVLSIASVTLHEIGHLLGLSHVGSETPLSDFKGPPDNQWNIMVEGVFVRTQCGRDPADVTVMDLPDFVSGQARMRRSAASGGSVWARLREVNYSYNAYVDSLNTINRTRWLRGYLKQYVTAPHRRRLRDACE